MAELKDNTEVEYQGGWDWSLDAEIATHLEMAVADRISKGEDPKNARISALREFGNVDLVRDVTAISRSGVWLLRLIRDLQYAIRRTRRNSYLSVAVISILALGLAAPSAVVSILWRANYPSTGIGNGDHVIRIERQGNQSVSFSQIPVLSGALHNLSPLAFSTDDRHVFMLQGRRDTTQISAPRVSSNFFSLLEVDPALGQGFDSHNSASRQIMLSDDVWRSSFDGDRAIIGQSVKVDGRQYMVAGVMPKGFRFPFHAGERGIWIQDLTSDSYPSKPFLVFARLVDRSSFSEVQLRLRALSETRSGVFVAEWVSASIVRREVKKGLTGVFVGSLIVWLVSCANAGGLFLTRCRITHKEVAIRQVLGASRARIRKQIWMEILLLSSIGNLVGLVLALALLHLVGPLLDSILHSHFDVRWNLTLGIIALIFAAANTILFALPSFADDLQVDRSPATALLSVGRVGRNPRKWLGITQITLSTAILTAAGLLISTAYAVQHSPLSFVPKDILVSSFRIPVDQASNLGAEKPFLQGLESRLRRIAGVRSVAFMSRAPFNHSYDISLSFKERGTGTQEESIAPVHLRAVTSAAETVFGFKMVSGRYFSESDTKDSPFVVVVNEAFVKERLGPISPEGALGKAILQDNHSRAGRIIGVMENVPFDSRDAPPEPEVDVCISQIEPWSRYYEAVLGLSITVAVKVDQLSPSTIAGVRNAIAMQSPALKQVSITDMTTLIDSSYKDRRLATYLSAVFGGATLILCATALYGQFAFTLRLERRNIGIRLALGAPPKIVTAPTIREALSLIVIGLFLGNLVVLISMHVYGEFFYRSGPARYLSPMVANLIVALTCLWSATIPYYRLTASSVARVMNGR